MSREFPHLTPQEEIDLLETSDYGRTPVGALQAFTVWILLALGSIFALWVIRSGFALLVDLIEATVGLVVGS